MTPTLDRDVAEAIYGILGNTYETEKTKFVPLPNFSELIRLLPKIGEKKGWATMEDHLEPGIISRVFLENVAWALLYRWMNAPTPEEGMKQVSEYLRKIL